MAKEFGGKFSPNGATPGALPTRAVNASGGFRSAAMFFAPLPLVLTGWGQMTAGNIAFLLRDSLAFVLLILGAFLLREGLRAEAAYRAERSARRPAFPRKIFAAVFCGLGVTAALWGGNGVLVPSALGLFACALHLFAFGLDPLQDKGEAGLETLADRRVAAAVADGEAHVLAMLDAAGTLRDRVLRQRIEGFANAAREMFRTVEDDPRDLADARRYLGVYLSGARAATEKFAQMYNRNPDMAARADYEALIADLQAGFDARRKEMLLDDRSDLDVEIDVLRDRLRREGVES